MTTIVDNSAETSDAEETGLRERKKQQTRAAIHDAAFRLVDAQGLEATTIDQICQEADVSTRTFFNYYPSKAAAALEMRGTLVDSAVRASFHSASGGLVAALCTAIASTAELRPSHVEVKQLITRRPELLTTLSQMMIEVRGQFVGLAAERASSSEQAELAVTLVMAALGRVMHDDGGSTAPLAEQLRETVDRIVGVNREELAPARPRA
jgi:AcrR family transcriptional regulator